MIFVAPDASAASVPSEAKVAGLVRLSAAGIGPLPTAWLALKPKVIVRDARHLEPLMGGYQHALPYHVVEQAGAAECRLER